MVSNKKIVLFLYIAANIFLAFENFAISLITYVLINVIFALKVVLEIEEKRRKFIVVLMFLFVLCGQFIYTYYTAENAIFTGIENVYIFFVGIVLISLSFYLFLYVERKNYNHIFFQVSSKRLALPFSDLSEFVELLNDKKALALDAKKVFTRENIKELIIDVSRNNSFRYINDGTLNDEYIETMKKSIDDERVYVVVSYTGTAMAQAIRLFTTKNFSHSSLSFDKELKTLVKHQHHRAQVLMG